MVVGSILDRSDASENTFRLHIDQFNGQDFVARVDIDELKVLTGSYTIGVKDGAFIKMSSENQNIEYFIIMLDDTI